MGIALPYPFFLSVELKEVNHMSSDHKTMNKQHTTPLILNGKPENQDVRFLEKVSLTSLPRQKDKEKLYDEDWIQNLIHNNPRILPVEELESAFFPLYPVCRELKTPAGYLDNLFVSENGSLTLVECKLWRNPEARREVVGQALDYAKEFAGWQYEDLSQAIQDTTGASGNVLFDVVASEVEELHETTFVDSVSKNLSRGRFLILIVGDGIREGVENISNFLQKHAGLDFTFGLVELGLFKVPEEEKYIIQPRVLARTYTIERAVIRVEGIQVKIESPETQNISYNTSGRRTNISEGQFYEELSTVNSTVAQELKTFVDDLTGLDITPVFGASSLNLRWFPEENLKMNFGSIFKTGKVDTGVSNWIPEKIGKVTLGHNYQRKLAGLIAGAHVREHEKPSCWEVHRQNQRIQISDLLSVKNEWKKVISETQTEILEVLSS